MLWYNIMTRNLLCIHIITLALAIFLPALVYAANFPVFRMQVTENAHIVEKQVTLDYFRGTPVLVAFWRSDCPPCLVEKPILTKIAAQHPALQVLLVSLDGDAYSQRHYPPSGLANMQTLFVKDTPAQILGIMGDRRMALPFSVFLSADGNRCDTHYGLLGTNMADDWMKRC